MNQDIGIIGGGWSGLSAAVELTHAGHAVTVYDAAKNLGGRARRVEVDGIILDNGQHLLIGAYSETLRLMEQVDPGSSRTGFLRLPLTLDYPDGISIRAPSLPAPLHLSSALMLARGISFPDKLAAIRFMQKLKRMDFNPPASATVGEAIASQPEKIRRYLWEPLCVAALNTPVEMASFRIFAKVLKDALTGKSSNSDFLIPRHDLSSLFPQPAADWLCRHGSTVKTRCRISALTSEGRRWKVFHAEGHAEHDRVIVATAAPHAIPLLENLPGCELVANRLKTLQYQPILTVYADYPSPLTFGFPLLGWVDPVPLFVFDMQASHGMAGRIAVVASANGPHLEWDNARWLDEIHTRMEQAMGKLPLPKIIQRITEKRATFASVPNAYRPPHATPCPGLFLAGDYADGLYPSTLEGAVRSGVECAKQLLAES
jgi:hydroxysqualene dehydroxylase